MSAETQRELGQAIGYRWGQGYHGDLINLKPLADHATIDDDTRVEAQKLLVDSDVIDDEIAFFHGFADRNHGIPSQQRHHRGDQIDLIDLAGSVETSVEGGRLERGAHLVSGCLVARQKLPGLDSNQQPFG